MSAWAKPGVQCVCIKRDGFECYPDECAPAFGQVLTVRTVEVFCGGLGLTFEEVVNEPYDYSDGFGEVAFQAIYFRPVVSQQDDVSLFAHHLDAVGEPA